MGCRHAAAESGFMHIFCDCNFLDVLSGSLWKRGTCLALPSHRVGTWQLGMTLVGTKQSQRYVRGKHWRALPISEGLVCYMMATGDDAVAKRRLSPRRSKRELLFNCDITAGNI